MPNFAGGTLLQYGLLAVLVVCVVAVVRTLLQMYRVRASASWPEVTGVVEDAAIEEAHREDLREAYSPRISYRYTVLGKEYVGHAIHLGDRQADTLERTRAITDQYAPATVVRVRYDPDRPERAVLEMSSMGDFVLPLIAELVMVTLGIWVLLRGV